MIRPLAIAGAGAATIAIVLGVWVYSDQPSETRVALPGLGDPAAGMVLYQENCAACHGDKLQGQPNWQSVDEDGRLPAPPHDETGHTWHHGDGLLFSYTKLGGKEVMARNGVDFDSAMPGFADRLDDQQIWDILAYIKSTWPDQQREVQATQSEAERLQKEASE